MAIRILTGTLPFVFLMFTSHTPAFANTLQNALTVYDEEVNIRTRYLAYAERADEEGYHGAAGLFRAVARANEINMSAFARLIKKMGGSPLTVVDRFPVDDTRRNLDNAARIAQVEWQKLYTQYMKEAQNENILEPMERLTYAKTAGNQHATLFRKAGEQPSEWKERSSVFVCSVCGYAVVPWPGRQCPSCHTVESFETIS